jgi:hypothetical protein
VYTSSWKKVFDTPFELLIVDSRKGDFGRISLGEYISPEGLTTKKIP